MMRTGSVGTFLSAGHGGRHARIAATLAFVAAFGVAPGHAHAQVDTPAGAHAAPTAGAISPEAKEHFAAGVAFLQDQDGEKVEEAYREFRTAFEMSGSAKILGNMGLCAMKLERDGEAVEAYARYLREVPNIDADERAQIVRDLQTLTIGVARLAISTDKPGVRLVDVRVPVRGERITNVYGPVDVKTSIGLRPGHHVITARLAGHDDATWEVEAYAGGRDEHAFVMRKTVVAAAPGPASERPTASVAPWVVMGVGGAMLAAGAITGVVALGKTSDLERECPNDVCPFGFDLEKARSDARSFVRLTDALVIGGGVVAAGGFTWWLLSRDDGKAAEKKSMQGIRRPRLEMPTAGCSPTGCGAAWGGTF
jgi:hypothetical protein